MKRGLQIILCIVLVLGFTGCGKENQQDINLEPKRDPMQEMPSADNNIEGDGGELV